MRFNLRQLLMGVAFVALTTAYATQSVRYRNLATRYDHLEERYATTREVIKHVTDISITDQEKGPDRFVMELELPEDWPAGIKDQWKDVPLENRPAVFVSRLSGVGTRTWKVADPGTVPESQAPSTDSLTQPPPDTENSPRRDR
jgi:hypothetical protein